MDYFSSQKQKLSIALDIICGDTDSNNISKLDLEFMGFDYYHCIERGMPSTTILKNIAKMYLIEEITRNIPSSN